MNARELVYADHHATTPVAPEVLDAMAPWLAFAGNPSSIHSSGRAARRAVEEARAEVARALGGQPEEIVFTSGGTEADNLAVRGAALAAREGDPARRRVHCTAAEHPAVLEAVRSLAPLGFERGELPVDADGLLRRDGFEAALAGGPAAVVSILLANNETGVVETGLGSLSAQARAAGAVVHTDAVQAVGKIRVDVASLGVDLLSLSGHKFGAPKGAGALWVRRGVRLSPLAAGGGQEKGRRAGTENVAALVGLGAAIRRASARLDGEAARIGALRDRFEGGLRAAIPGLVVNGTALRRTVRLPTATSATFPGAPGEILAAALDLEGIAVSNGSACASGTTRPSHVLLAMGRDTAAARETLRFSFGATTRAEDVDRLLEAVPRLWRRAARASAC